MTADLDCQIPHFQMRIMCVQLRDNILVLDILFADDRIYMSINIIVSYLFYFIYVPNLGF